MKSKESSVGPLSQSAIASFIFSSIQMTISIILVVITNAIKAVKSIPTPTSIYAGAPSPDYIEKQDLILIIVTSVPGILGLAIAVPAAYSIRRKGKSGLGLTVWSVLISSTFLAIHLFSAL